MNQNIQTIQLIDWLVIAGYAAGMLLTGIYFSLKAKTSADYLLGGRHMKSWAVGLSLFATLFSTISYMAYPGEMIRFGPMLFCGWLVLPLIYWVVGWFLIPAFMKLNITSANELLEIRLGVSLKLLAAILFLLTRLLWMALVIHICSANIIVPLMNWGVQEAFWVSLTIGLITVVYTSLGGLKAVVVTDVIQTFILFGGAVLSLILIGKQIGWPMHWIPAAWPDEWVRFSIFDVKERVCLFTATTTMFAWYICVSGSDQMAVQRYLATTDIKAARRGFLVSVMSASAVAILLAFLGVGLIAYFKANPQLLPPGQLLEDSADDLFPRFIMIGLPVGLTGLVISGLMAAAMSSLSSGVNSSCLVISRDFIESFSKRQYTEQQKILMSRLVSLALGVIAVSGSLIIGNVPGNIVELGHKTVGLFIAPLFIPFFMAMFVKTSHERAVFWGTLLGTLSAISIAFSGELSELFFNIGLTRRRYTVGFPFLWITPLSLVVGVTFSWLFNYIMPRK